MKLKYLILSGGIFCSTFLFSQSEGNPLEICRPPGAKIDLDINNVRAGLLNGGDMWWTLTSGHYEVPVGSGVDPVFSGALWFGALDDGGQLLTAAMTYRQSGYEFWPGPIDTTTLTVKDSVCEAFNRFWKLKRSEVEAFAQHFSEPNYVIPEAILSWPGNGNSSHGQSHFLAPFFDADGDGIYNPHNGDYPAFALNGNSDCNYDLLGDQAIWWVLNDVAGDHTETDSQKKFGMEVHAMAFAYRTNNSLNDETMYRYRIINHSNGNWNQMWMGQFADVDIGAFDDDYVGCDVQRGMGYGYNGDMYDGTSPIPAPGTYGEHPPAVGFDFLQGPLADANDLIDNDRDSLMDEPGERIKLSMFKYYNGDFSAIGNPEIGNDYYDFLRGFWKDGSPQTYGNSGYGGTIISPFMFPGSSDPYGWGTGGIPQLPWSELTVNNTPSDRRLIESVGPFTMSPGEVQTVIIGVPWARDTAGDNFDAITKLQEADDYLQQMFDNCFALPCSADAAPSFATAVNGTIVYFTAEAGNGTYQWNFGDNTSSTQKHPSHNYNSAGTYTVCFSVTNACGTQTVCKEVIIIIPTVECGPAIQRLEGKGSGNQVIDFMPASVSEIFSSTDQRTHFPWYKPLHAPVKVTYENYVSMVNGDYRIAFDSVSNSAHWKMWIVGTTDTVFSDSTIASGYKQLIPQWGLGVKINQVAEPGMNRNPDRNGFLEATISFADPTKNWLSGIADTDYPSSYNWIRSGTVQGSGSDPCSVAFDDRYMSNMPVDANSDYENLIGATWAPYRLTANNLNPISSNVCYYTGPAYWDTPTMVNNTFENLSNVDVVFTSDKSKWTRCIVLEIGTNIALNLGGQPTMLIRSQPSVDKEGRSINQGGISDVNNPDAADYIGSLGMSWFPGYAINLETGERLNMAFGENSSLTSENGRDLLWNPTSATHSQYNDPLFGGMHYIYVFGHNGDAVYSTPYPSSPSLAGQLRDVPVYDAGKMMDRILSLPPSEASSQRTEIFRDAMWVSIPLLNPGHTILETDATVRLRIAKPFEAYNTSSTPINNDFPLYGFTIDKLNLACNYYDGEVIAYPNPFSENCTIFFNNTENEVCNLLLYDLRGRLVRTYTDVHSDRIVISGLGLDEGVYIYSLQKGIEKPMTGKIIFR